MPFWNRDKTRLLPQEGVLPESHAPNMEADPTSTKAAVLFTIMYGHDATSDELARMAAFNVEAIDSWAAVAHRMISINERHAYPTPFLVRFGPENVHYFRMGDYELALDNADESISIPIVRDNGIEKDVTAFVRRTLKEGMNFVDIGANVGYFSMLAASLVGTSGSVQAFEPNSENCRLIMLSRERNGYHQVRINAVALGNSVGTAFFSQAVGSNGAFLSQTADQLMNPQCMIVPVMRLDDMIVGSPDLIKIDVEGAESLVFEGGEKVLRESRPIIVSEFQVEMLRRVSGIDPKDYLNRMISIGYDISRLAGSTTTETPIDDVGRFLSEDLINIWHLHELVFRPR